LMRRNVPMIYIVEDNGCYGLTKGQFSATADIGSSLKSGIINQQQPIDVCTLAIQLGATYVARSFSGDKKQLQAILKGAMSHRGTAMIDVISPCVTFNDHQGSTKSYEYVREKQENLQEVGFVPFFDEIHLEEEQAPGEVREVTMHDGSKLLLKRVDQDYDPTDRVKAIEMIERSGEEGHLLTGVFYVDTERPTFIDMLNLDDDALGTLPPGKVRPPKSALAEVMEELT
jgi:2-oxoglutarate/2-oxoacid ferredoxin oxidoreductase subunit beta